MRVAGEKLDRCRAEANSDNVADDQAGEAVQELSHFHLLLTDIGASTVPQLGFPLPISALNGERVRVRGRRLLECVAAPDAFFPLRPLTLRSYAACATGPLPVLAKVLDGESECTLLFENLTGNAKRFS